MKGNVQIIQKFAIVLVFDKSKLITTEPTPDFNVPDITLKKTVLLTEVKCYLSFSK